MDFLNLSSLSYHIGNSLSYIIFYVFKDNEYLKKYFDKIHWKFPCAPALSIYVPNLPLFGASNSFTEWYHALLLEVGILPLECINFHVSKDIQHTFLIIISYD